MPNRITAVLLFASLVMLSLSDPAGAWGPATHVKLAGDLLSQLHLLPAGVAMILARCSKDYFFGNIAADVVLAKRWSRIRQVCHHWRTGLTILDDAHSDRGRAFALGYLSHLAADTVAHNKFIPRQMTLTRGTISFGHLYWELRADATISSEHWLQLRQILDEVFSEHETSLQMRLTDTFLPFEVNWRLFHRTNRFLIRQVCRRTIDRWSNYSRWRLPANLMDEYQTECLDRMIDVVSRPRESRVLHEDPNGNAALAYTRLQRRQLRQMARGGLITPHVLYEAAMVHAPAGPTYSDLARQQPMP